MRIAVDHLLPNPFRRTERYPLKPGKVAALVESINTTQFWDNLLARPAPKKGYFELAYGHHRLEALKQTDIKFIDIPVRDLSNEAMIQIMARENMSEWKYLTEVEQETVRTTVEAFAEGKVTLPPVDSGERASVRFAPSFSVGDGCTGIHPSPTPTTKRTKEKASKAARDDQRHLAYTPEILAAFLGMKLYAVRITLDALIELDNGLNRPEDFVDMQTQQAKQIVAQARYANEKIPDSMPNKAAHVRSVIDRIVSGMRQSIMGIDRYGKQRMVKDVTVNNARATADAMLRSILPKQHRKPPPEAEQFIDRLLVELRNLPSEHMTDKLKALRAAREELDEADRVRLGAALRGTAERFNDWAEHFEGGKKSDNAHTTKHTTVVPLTRRIGSH